MSELNYQFRSNSILAYYKRSKKKSAHSVLLSEARKQSIENFKKQERYTGLVTDGSQRRLTRALENLLQIAQPKEFTYVVKKGQYKGQVRQSVFKVNFVTLTIYSFSRKVPGKEAHKNCLEPFLRWLRGKGMTAYVWKAELQSKRQDCHQLHYHLTTDVYVDKYELRDKWNELQRKAGYLDYWYQKKQNYNPNSTDVHSTHNRRNLIGYLKKSIVRYSDKKRYEYLKKKSLQRGSIKAEMTKKNQNKETIEGKVWDCSQNIKVSFYEIKDFADVTRRIATGVMVGELQEKKFERCTVYELKKYNQEPKYFLPWIERQFYEDHLKRMREFQRLKPDIYN